MEDLPKNRKSNSKSQSRRRVGWRVGLCNYLENASCGPCLPRIRTSLSSCFAGIKNGQRKPDTLHGCMNNIRRPKAIEEGLAKCFRKVRPRNWYYPTGAASASICTRPDRVIPSKDESICKNNDTWVYHGEEPSGRL